MTLREYIETILEEREKALRLTAINLEHRLDSLNALRNEVLSDRSQFISKGVYDQSHQDLIRRIDRVEAMQAKIVGVGIVLVVLSGVVGTIIAHLLKW